MLVAARWFVRAVMEVRATCFPRLDPACERARPYQCASRPLTEKWQPSHRRWCDPVPCSQVTADAAGTFLVAAKEGTKQMRAAADRHRSVASDLLVEVHIRVVREAARRQLGWDMNVRDRSNDYCTDLVGAWAGPRRIMSKSGPYYRPENTNLSESDGLRVRPA